MLNTSETFGIDPAGGHPERALAFTYAPARVRSGLLALFALDALLAKLARHTREPIVAQMRLAWWRDALGAIETTAVAGQPILEVLHRDVVPAGVEAALLVSVVDGWEALIADDPAAHGRQRGRALFAAAARVLNARDAWVDDAGEGWALADLALTTPNAPVAAAARGMAKPLLDRALAEGASRAARPLGALALSGRADLAGHPEGSPARLMRLLGFRLTGR